MARQTHQGYTQDPNRYSHSDTEPTDEYAREREDRGFNWKPLLLIPLFFLLGWMSKDAVDDRDAARDEARQYEYGVGGGPGINCPTPGLSR